MRTQPTAPFALAILFSLSAGAQVPLSPTQAPAATAPTPQKQQPLGGGRQPLPSPIETLPQTHPKVQVLNGVLMGYLYWDASTISFNANSTCPFQLRVNQGTPPSGGSVGFEQFTEIGTYKNNFSSVGTIGKYTVCQYAVDHLPEDKDLEVQIGPMKGALQTPVVFTIPPTANDPNRPVMISGGKCNQLPPAVPSLATLGSAWWTCGDHAYNLNYLMQPAKSIPGLTSIPPTITPLQSQPLLLGSGATNGMAKPGPQQQTLLPPPGAGTAGPGSTPKPNQ